MSHKSKVPADPKTAERMERMEKHDHRVEHFFRRVLHVIERIVAALSIIALLTMKPDGAHFDSPACREFGKRYFEQYRLLTK